MTAHETITLFVATDPCYMNVFVQDIRSTREKSIK